jgi:uroporphyrinogen-III synthase
VTRPLLILRPQPGADATAARARALGLEPVVAPLFTIAPLAWEAPDPAAFDALLLTSANAARCGGPALVVFTALPCWTVGEATAVAARAAGFVDVMSGPSDGVALARAAAAAGVRRALHLHGRDHMPLSAPGLSIVGCAVYVAEAVSALPASIVAAREPIGLLHSPRAASLFAALVGERSGIALAAISQAAADAAGDGWAEVEVAEEPRDEALLEVAVKLCHKDRTPSAGTGGADGL